MTIEEYRNLRESEIKYPVNGAGYQMPQLVDDLWNAMENLIFIRKNCKYDIVISEAQVSSIAYLNRAISQLGIELK